MRMKGIKSLLVLEPTEIVPSNRPELSRAQTLYVAGIQTGALFAFASLCLGSPY